MNPARLRSSFYLGLSSFVIAFVIWLIAKQGDLDTDWLSVTLKLENIPENMKVNALRDVQLNVQYPTELSNRIVPKNFDVGIDVAEIFSGEPDQWTQPFVPKEEDYVLERGNVRMRNLGPDVRVVGFEPRTIKLTAELLTKRLKVVAPTTGDLPSYLVLTGEPRPDPPEVIVTGSHQALYELSELETEPVNLSPIRESRGVPRGLRLPKGIVLLNPLEKTIKVSIALTALKVDITIDKVPITLNPFAEGLTGKVDPSHLSVIVRGSDQVLRGITRHDFEIQLTPGLVEELGNIQDVDVKVRLKQNHLIGSMEEQIDIVSWDPEQIRVEFFSTKGGD